MCLTTEALALFLSLVGPEIVSSSSELITVHAEKGDVMYHAVGSVWCTGDAQLLAAQSTDS